MIVCAGFTAHRAVELQRQAAPLEILADRSTLELLGSTAQISDERPDRATLTGLSEWPSRQAIVELGDRILSQVEDKIDLLEPFVAPPLASRMRRTPMGWRLDGELREPVILFVELAGLDEDEEALDDDSVTNVSRSLLRAYRKYGGTTLKADLAEQGHRLMIVFGLHDPSETDAERALMAALEASTRMRAFTIAQGLKVTVRTGVHTGKVFFGAIGSDYKHDITLVGDAVNVAARAASVAEPFQVLATDDVLRDARSAFATSTRGPVALKGKSVPLTLHSVHSAASGQAHYLRLRKNHRFCAGRTHQADLMQQIASRALAGEGHSVGVVGEAGTGKSFLLANVVDDWIEAGGMGIHTRCRLATRSSPLAPILTIIRAGFGISPNDDQATRRDRIRTALRRYQLGSAPELVALLQPVYRPDGTTEALVDLADPRSRERLMASIGRFVEQRVEQEPFLVIIEDLQQADSLTIELVMRLASAPRGSRFLFITTYRPDPAVTELRRALDLRDEGRRRRPGHRRLRLATQLGQSGVPHRVHPFSHAAQPLARASRRRHQLRRKHAAPRRDRAADARPDGHRTARALGCGRAQDIANGQCHRPSLRPTTARGGHEARDGGRRLRSRVVAAAGAGLHRDGGSVAQGLLVPR